MFEDHIYNNMYANNRIPKNPPPYNYRSMFRRSFYRILASFRGKSKTFLRKPKNLNLYG